MKTLKKTIGIIAGVGLAVTTFNLANDLWDEHGPVLVNKIDSLFTKKNDDTSN